MTPGAPGHELHIERLVLAVGGLEEPAARQLAELVAEGLAASRGPRLGAGRIAALRLELDGAGLEAPLLAERVVEAIARALARDAPGQVNPGGVR